jgi:hypothetical protein
VSSYIDIEAIIPLDWETFKTALEDVGKLLIDWDNFSLYAAKVGKSLSNFLMIVSLLLPVVVLLFFLARMILLSETNKECNADSKPLQLHRKLEKKLYKPVIDWLKCFFEFLKPVYSKLLFIWLLIHTNAAAIILEIFAYLFYWVVSFDTVHLYLQAYKLTIDVAYMLTTLPLVIWVVIALYILNKIRRWRGLRKLREFEEANREQIEGWNLVLLIYGSMGSKKTMTLTDIGLTSEAMFRDKALELLQECDAKFPAFPWCNFEKEFQTAVADHTVWDLPSAKKWVKAKADTFRETNQRADLFDYDYVQYGLEYIGELEVRPLFDILESYAQLYFLYSAQTSLIYSNYSVRTDNILETKGHFHRWDTDFFDRDSRKQDAESRYSHILNFDNLRLVKRVDEKHLDHVFGFGIIEITEVGKERGNMLELMGLQKSADDANQKNDGFNYSLKMARHKATIENVPFVRFYTDEQRPESWGADARDLCTLLKIDECSDEKLAMPWFFIEELIHDILYEKIFLPLYTAYRHERSDNTLIMYGLKRAATKLHKYYEDTTNKFGYYVSTIVSEAGTRDGGSQSNKYYLSKKKGRAKRYKTDCYSEILTSDTTRRKSIDEVNCYSSVTPTITEFGDQRSYFIAELLGIANLNKIDTSLSPAVANALLKAYESGNLDREKIALEYVNKRYKENDLRQIENFIKNTDDVIATLKEIANKDANEKFAAIKAIANNDST